MLTLTKEKQMVEIPLERYIELTSKEYLLAAVADIAYKGATLTFDGERILFENDYIDSFFRVVDFDRYYDVLHTIQEERKIENE